MSQLLAQSDTVSPVKLQTSDSSIRLIGYLILLGTFGIFGGWAAFAPLDSAALAQGVVTVKSYRKTVQHLQGGIVKEIRVRDGEQVAKGDLLLELDDTQARAQLEILKGQYISTKALESRLLSERDGLTKVIYPEEISAVDDRRVEDALRGQNQVFNTRRNAYDGEVSVLEQRVQQLRSQIKGLEALGDSKNILAGSYEEEVLEYRSLVSDGYADKQRLRELERNHARLLGEVAENLAQVARIEMQIGETQLQILQLKKNAQTEVANQLGEVQPKLFDLEERITAIKDTVSRARIYAPESGMVLGMTVHTEGGVVGPGAAILDIVPQSEELIVEAQVSPVDIDRVANGLLADIRFSAFKSATTPVIEGQVMSLSADRLVNQQTGMPYYLARVAVTEKGRLDLKALQLVPGMPAEVLINTGSRTLLEYLIQPATNAFARSLIED